MPNNWLTRFRAPFLVLLLVFVTPDAAGDVPPGAIDATNESTEALPAQPITVAQADGRRRRWPRRRWRRHRRRRPRPKTTTTKGTKTKGKTATTKPEPPPPPRERIPWGIQKAAKDVKHFHVLFTADVFGRYAWPGCDARPTNHADMSHFGAAVRKRAEEISKAGDSYVVVSAGSMTRPDILGPHVFATDPTLAWTAVDLIKSVGFDAVSVGIFDYNLPLAGRKRYMRLMNKAGIPLLSGNVNCGGKRIHPCANFGRRGKRYVVIERNGIKIGLASVVRDDLAIRMTPKKRRGMKVEDAVETARQTVRTLRHQEKVDFIVLIANVNIESDTPLPVVDFVRRLGTDDPELVVANSMFERDADDFFSEVRQGHGPLIVGTDRFGQTMGEAVFHYRRDKDKHIKIHRAVVHRHRASEAKPRPEDDKKARRLIDGLCEVIDQRLGKSEAKRTLTYMGFMSYLMDIMRTETKAEVALLNQRAVADTPFPMTGKITKEMILRAIRSETTLGSYWVSGARLQRQLEQHMGGDSDLLVQGVKKKGKKWSVNGRGLQPAAEYRVATTAYLAAGGNMLLNLTAQEKFSDTRVSLRKHAIDFFSGEGPARDGDPAVDPQEDFPDLSREWLLFSSADIAFGLNDATVTGNLDERRARPDLLQDQSLIFQVDSRLRAGGVSRNHRFDGFFRLRFKKMWKLTIRPVDCSPADPADLPAQCNGGSEHTYKESRIPVDGIDRLRVGLTYRSLAARALAGRDKWYAPEPYVESTLITELTESRYYTNSADNIEYYRHGILNNSIGVGISPSPLFFAKVGFAVRRELFTPVATGLKLTTMGAYLGWVLNKWKVLGGDFPMVLESTMDFFFTDFGGALQNELTAATRIKFALTRRIQLSIGDELLLFGRDGHFMVAHNIAIGLGIDLDYRRQTF